MSIRHVSADNDHHRRSGEGGQRQLLIALLMTVGFMLVELVIGYLSGSLALVADAGHMFTDASALGLSCFAAWISTRPATPEKTFGYYRTEILAALVNGVVLWLLVIFIYVQALQRLHQPQPIQSGPMLAVAILGLAVNLLSSRILLKANDESLNVQSARVHVLSDALGSIGVIVAAVLIRWRGWTVADPLASLLIGLLVAISSWTLVKRSVNILLEGAPPHLSVPYVTHVIRNVPGVREVHDVHVWTISTGLEAMSGHVVVQEITEGPTILQAINGLLADRFGIHHTTFQLEPCNRTCELTSEHGTNS